MFWWRALELAFRITLQVSERFFRNAPHAIAKLSFRCNGPSCNQAFTFRANYRTFKLNVQTFRKQT